MNNTYRDLLGQVKISHIFSCSGDDSLAMLLAIWRSNLSEHLAVTHIASNVKSRKFNCPAEVWAHSVVKLKVLKCIGLNPYKAVEIWKNYRPVVPLEFHVVDKVQEAVSKGKDFSYKIKLPMR